MSVADPVIDYIDGPSRRIHLLAGVRSWSPVDDIYPEVRQLRADNEELRQFDMFCSALPLIDKGGGVKTGRGLLLLGGTRIIPFDEPATHRVTGELLSDTGVSGPDLIETTGLTSAVRINYAPPPATEVIEVQVGAGEIDDLVRAFVAGRIDIESQPDGSEHITAYAEDEVTALRTLRVSADGLTRTVL